MTIRNAEDFMAVKAPLPDSFDNFPRDKTKHLVPLCGRPASVLTGYNDAVKNGSVTVRLDDSGETKTFYFPFDSNLLANFLYGGAV